jgi:hypothetical protein
MQWFEIDKLGLAKVLARKGKAFAALELLQNAWDQNVTVVRVNLEKAPGSRYATLSVQDDDPKGFADLSHAFTLFAESEKKSNPTKRGRFNLGEKLVLALCEEAEIRTVSGSVRFDKTGRHKSRKGTARGSEFIGKIKMTNAELDEALATLEKVLPPIYAETTLNGRPIRDRESLCSISLSLPTEVCDEEGYLRRVQRKTTAVIFKVRDDEPAMLYEMGIPVVETGDQYHVDIQQKIPLSLERDNVSASYLRTVRTAVLNEMHTFLDEESSTSAWVRDALADRNCSSDAIRSAVKARFGDKAVAYDPSDPEANKLAVAKGHVVVHGGHLSGPEWDNVRRAEALTPAGQVTPSAKPFSDDPAAPQLKVVEEVDWSEDEAARVEDLKIIAKALIGKPIQVRIAADKGWRFDAAFGGMTLTVNRSRVGRSWFEGPVNERVLSLLIHEFGHYYCSDHLSHRFHDALCDLGGRLALWLTENPERVRPR